MTRPYFSSSPCSRTLIASLLSVAALLSTPAVLAKDEHAAQAAETKATAAGEKKPAAAAPAEKKPPAATPAAQTSATDSMDRLRERLAERLGAAQAPSSRSPYVVRVPNKAAGPAAARVSAPREARAAHSAHAAAPAPAAMMVATAAATPAAMMAGAAPHPAAAAGQAAAALLVPTHAAARSPAARLPHGAPASPAAPAGHAHWSYQGDAGPQAWGSMQADFNQCSSGQRQSPIDIRGGIQVELEPIKFEYRASGFTVIDNGHTVQVNLQPGNAVTVLGRRYDLLQFHFHRPSEERINGRQFDMVAHLVHKDPDGKLAVVAVLLDRGSAQPLVQAVWNALPLEKGEEQPASTLIDLNQLLPQDKRYYTYMGSLTTPPCSEGVLWMVMKQPVQLSSEQINIFSRLYPMNARPVQQVAGRLIKESQ